MSAVVEGPPGADVHVPPAAALLDGGAEAYPRMLRSIAAARASVHLEVYAFADDDTGDRFVLALANAAARGVRVSVVLDGWGSAGPAVGVAARLREAGCAVTIYNPISAFLAGRFRRNHRKVLVVDREVAFVGGINIGDDYGRLDQPDVPRWIDLALELRGPVVAWLSGRLAGSRTPAPPGPVRIHLSSLGGGRKLRQRYLKVIGGARRRLLVAHAYFLPDRRLVRSITAAARRGVDVQLLLPGRSDVVLARAASRRLYGQLLRAGVRISEWHETVLHAKAAVADGRRLLVGSFNLDPFSLANLEALVEVHDRAVAAAGEAWMERLLSKAVPVSPGDLAARPRLVRWVVDAFGLAAHRLAHRIARLLAVR